MAVLHSANHHEVLACHCCGRLVDHEQWVGESFTGRQAYYWLAPYHVGMCGKPCVGGWLAIEDVDSDTHTFSCEECELRIERR